MTQLAPAARLLPQAFSVPKSDGLAVTPVMLSGEPPLFVTVTFCGRPDVPAYWLGKEILEGDTDTRGVGIDVPIKLIVWGLSAALSVRPTVAPRDPELVGVNVIWKTQELLGLTLAPLPHVEPFAIAKSPEFEPPRATAWIFRIVDPTLRKVTFCAALVVPRGWFPNTTLVEDRLTIGAGGTPVPISGTGTGLPERLFAITTLAVRFPAAVGAKVTLIEQLAAADKLPTQLLVSVKSETFAPLIETLAMVRAEDSLLLRVTVWGALVVPTGWLEKDRLAGDRRNRTYNSELVSAVPLYPPATTTVPLFRSVAVWPWRAVLRLPVGVKVPVVGSYSSALARATRFPAPP
jgi:hypothetical protein